jgi:hypothetical protein
MSQLRQFGRFWYDFVIGDDWRLAVGALVALGLAGGLAHANRPAWWVAPPVIAALLGFSVLRASPRGP